MKTIKVFVSVSENNGIRPVIDLSILEVFKSMIFGSPYGSVGVPGVPDFKIIVNFNLEVVSNHQDADVVILGSREKLDKFYNDWWKQDFLFIPLQVKQLPPANAKELRIHHYDIRGAVVKAMAEFFQAYEPKVRDPEMDIVRTSDLYLAKNPTTDSVQVLVIDDKIENLKLALDLLTERHSVTLTSGYGEAMDLLKTNKYDAILTDCDLPVRTITGTALSSSNIDFNALGHIGLLQIFELTAMGHPVALVTAGGNHHADWQTAMLNKAGQTQVVNGQPVVFFTSGKPWDKALEALLKAKNSK